MPLFILEFINDMQFVVLWIHFFCYVCNILYIQSSKLYIQYGQLLRMFYLFYLLFYFSKFIALCLYFRIIFLLGIFIQNDQSVYCLFCSLILVFEIDIVSCGVRFSRDPFDTFLSYCVYIRYSLILTELVSFYSTYVVSLCI